MPKQIATVNDFSGGLNSFTNPKDLKDNEFAQNFNAVVDWNGVIRVGGMHERSILSEGHNVENEAGGSATYFQPGHGLFQFSSDYSLLNLAVFKLSTLT